MRKRGAPGDRGAFFWWVWGRRIARDGSRDSAGPGDGAATWPLLYFMVATYILAPRLALPTAKAPPRHAKGVPTIDGAPSVRRAGPALARRSLARP
jgi:hypothetical protein